MTNEIEPREKGYSAERFVNNLQAAWGGNLYLSVAPSFISRLTDIIPRAPHGIEVIATAYEDWLPSYSKPNLKGLDIVEDFRQIVIAGTPHPNRAIDRIHLLGDFMCREELIARLENFLRLCGDLTEEQYPISDQLPFRIHGQGSLLFDTGEILPHLSSYIDRGVDRRFEMADRLGLLGGERQRFGKEFEDSLEEVLEAVELREAGDDDALHPIVQLFAGSLLVNYGYNQLRRSGENTFQL